MPTFEDAVRAIRMAIRECEERIEMLQKCVALNVGNKEQNLAEIELKRLEIRHHESAIEQAKENWKHGI